MQEEERKFDVDRSFVLPDLSGPGVTVVPLPPKRLNATYFDTEDLRLTRAGASLRYRRGDDEPWTVKLATDVPGVRQEVSRAGRPGRPPAELTWLVASITRGATLNPLTVLRSRRRRWELHDDAGRVLAEIDDDSVSVLDGPQVVGRFREIEVERRDGPRKILSTVEKKLLAAGARTGAFTPKLVRALVIEGRGELAQQPPDVVAPLPALPAKPTAAEVVTQAIRRAVGRILAHDPLVRLNEPLPDGDTPVHQMRVGCRRLRSDLRTFGPLVQQEWSAKLRTELGWLAGLLGAGRDAEVLRARLHSTAVASSAAAEPEHSIDPAIVARFDELLASRQEAALSALQDGMRSDRYLALLEMLVAATRQPPLKAKADSPARKVLPELVAGPWRRLKKGGKGTPGPGALTVDGPDADWHAVRIHAKRARYAVEAVAEAIGGKAPQLAKKLAAVQELLGEHQDAAVAAETWLFLSEDPALRDDRAAAVVAGRLFERERVAAHATRAAFGEVWRSCKRRELRAWLP